MAGDDAGVVGTLVVVTGGTVYDWVGLVECELQSNPMLCTPIEQLLFPPPEPPPG